MVYRWHSCISQKDEAWTENMYEGMFGKQASEVSMQELLMGLAKWDHELDKDPLKREFANLERGADGKFADGDLVNIISDAIEVCSGLFSTTPPPGHNDTNRKKNSVRIASLIDWE